MGVLPYKKCWGAESSIYSEACINSRFTNPDWYLAACEAAIRKKGRRLNQTIIPCMFVGPPDMGKTSLMRRLIGKPPLTSLPSTGVADKVIQVEIRRLTVHAVDSVWSEPLTLDDEAIMLLMNISQSLDSHSHSNLTPSYSSSDESSDAASTASSSDSDNSSNAASIATSSNLETSMPSSFKPPLEMLKDALLQTKDQQTALKHLEGTCIVYLTDTGGQLEFQELLSALVSGSCIFFLVFRLDQDLDKRFTVNYRHPVRGNTEAYESSYTMKEFLLHTLASIATMGTFRYEGTRRQQVSKPKVVFVGTHKDRVTEEEIKQKDDILQKEIISTDHYKKSIIHFASKDRLIIAVNNLSSDESDIQLVRSAVEHISMQGGFDISAPPQWLIFSFAIRNLKESVLTYDECFAIAKKCGIDTHKELDEVLGFLNTKGLIRHFQGTGVDEDLKQVVILDPQVLFNEITKLVIATFTFEKTGHFISEEFSKKGIFSYDVFEKITATDHNRLLTPAILLKLLQHLHIIAPVHVSGEKKYVMPCILAHTETVDSVCISDSQITTFSKAPPLLVCFYCGYCPKGLFCSIAVYLLNNRMESWLNWELDSDKIFRDQISFSVHPYDSVSLKVTPKFLEILCSSRVQSRKLNFPLVCKEIRTTVEKGIRTVASTLNYRCNASHFLSFYCPHNHPTQILYLPDRTPCNLKCLCCSSPNFYDLPEKYEVWFDEVCHFITMYNMQ